MPVVHEGGEDLYRAMVYGAPHPTTLNWIRQQFQEPTPVLAQYATDFQNRTREMYERYSSHQAVARMQQLARAAQHMYDEDSIRPLYGDEALQFATPVMQRFIMAEPELRALYHRQLVDGYSDSYQDLWHGLRGQEHYDYRRATQGLVVQSDESWKATTYFDELLEGDRELILDEQVAIQQAWLSIRASLTRRKDDPTSRYGAQLS